MSSFLDDLQFVYGDVMEPIFCFIYATLIIVIFRSNNAIFRSQFYIFSMATGVCAICNVLLNFGMRMIDVRTRLFPERALLCNIDSWLSHCFALSLTIGKILTVTTRFTSICMPIKERNFWTPRMTNGLLIGMFLGPMVLFSFFPFQSASFAPTPDGYGRYLGIAGEGFKIAKAISTAGYVLFFVTTIPMCAMAIVRLRRERMAMSSPSRSIPKYERSLLVYAIILTLTHLLKSILQVEIYKYDVFIIENFHTIWFIALYTEATQLQTTIVNNYLIPNTLSSFAEPVLLLFTSTQVRNELLCCAKRRVRSLSVPATTFSNTPIQPTSPF